MARDFLSNQVKTKKIIASGSSSSTEPKLIVYGDSSSTDSVGGINSDMLNNVGNDVFLFVSGSICGKQNNIPKSVTVFGGDVVVSGLLYGLKSDATLWEIDSVFDDSLTPTNILDGDTGLFAIDFNEFTDVDSTFIYSQYTMTNRREAADKYFEFDSDGNVMPRDLVADAALCQSS
jgi:hypothetical protein